MDTNRLLVMLRLARPAGQQGFCPACGLDVAGTAATARGMKMAAAGAAVAVVLLVAGAGWAITAWQMLRSDMAMGLGTLTSFATTWTVMMAAMMLPSAIPLVVRFAREAEGRRTGPLAIAVLALVYLAVWLAFGVVCYLAYNSLGMPWRRQGVAGGAALGLAAL
jgi:predicted metal-binding membrane protein